MSVRILAWGPLKYVYTEQLHTRGPRLGPQHAREKIFDLLTKIKKKQIIVQFFCEINSSSHFTI